MDVVDFRPGSAQVGRRSYYRRVRGGDVAFQQGQSGKGGSADVVRGPGAIDSLKRFEVSDTAVDGLLDALLVRGRGRRGRKKDRPKDRDACDKTVRHEFVP